MPRGTRSQAAAEPTTVEVAMVYKKTTPGTYVFVSDADDAAVTQLYVRKGALNGVTINEESTVTLTVSVS